MNDQAIIESLLAGSTIALDPVAGSELSSRVEELRRMLDAIEDIRAREESLPRVGSKQLRSLYALHKVRKKTARASVTEWIIGILLFDSARAPAPSGVRGATAPRVLRFGADGFSLELIASDSASRDVSGVRLHHVSGEITAPAETTIASVWSVEEQDPLVLETDVEGMFAVSLDPGMYCFEVQSGTKRFVTPPLRIPAG